MLQSGLAAGGLLRGRQHLQVLDEARGIGLLPGRIGTEQAGLYSRLATKAGFACTVGKYAMFPSKAREEVVELQCSNRPDGGVAVFDADGKIMKANPALGVIDGRVALATR